MSKRNALRSAILGSGAKFKKEVVQVNDESYEIREPSKGILRDLINKSKSDSGEIDGLSLSTWAVIYCTYEPGSEVKVFEEGDYATLNNLPISHEFNKLIITVSKFLNTEEDFEKK